MEVFKSLYTGKQIEDKLSSNIVEILHEDLRETRYTGELIPGQLYRIIDYQCTTTQADTISANHQFDIIVLALSNNKLAEECWAVQHEGDTYFTDCNLAAWKLWYTIDNDKTKYKWADETNGKGVIYRMIDEFGNDCPYDFKNIMFKRYIVNELSKYFKNNSILLIDTLAINRNFGYLYVGITGGNSDTNIFQNSDNISNSRWFYTFSFLKTVNNITDNTVKSLMTLDVKHPYNNIIKNRQQASLTSKLPNNVLINYTDTINVTKIFDNTIINSFDITILNNCYSNKFDSCHEIFLYNNCYKNKFDNSLTIAIGENSFDNIITSSQNIIISSECSSNRINKSNTIIMPSMCGENIFDNNCSHIHLANDCYRNKFDNAKYIIFGIKYSGNFLLNEIESLYGYIENCVFESALYYLYLDNNSVSNDIISNIHFLKGKYNTSVSNPMRFSIGQFWDLPCEVTVIPTGNKNSKYTYVYAYGHYTPTN